MPDIYVYNGTNKVLDLSVSILDIMTARGCLVPPGQQGHFTTTLQSDIDNTIALLTQYGGVPHSSIANASTFTGVSHSTSGPASVGAVVPTVVTVAPPSRTPSVPVQPPAPAPTPPKKK